MDISVRGLEFIKRKEGYFDKAYLCPAKVWTIGWGSIRWSPSQPVKQGDVCTVEQAEKLLLREIRKVEDDIDETITVPLTQGQFDCLVSFFYNLGTGWLTGRGHQQATFVKYLNRGQYEKVPSELMKFRMANGKPLKGLEIRRKEEIQKLWLADYDMADGGAARSPHVVETNPEIEPMPQKVEPAVPSTTAVIKESPTAKLSLFGMLITAATKVFEWTFSVAGEAGTEAAVHQKSVSGLSALFSFLGTSATTISAIVVIGALFIVFQRRIAEDKG